MKFGIMTCDWGEHPDVGQMLRDMKETGWEGCEVRLSLDWMGRPERLKRLSEESGCEIFCLSSPKPIAPHARGDRGVEFNKRRVEYAAAAGVKNVSLFPPFRPRDRRPTASEVDNFAQGAEEVAEYASQFGIAVSFHHHTHQMVETIAEVEVVLRQTSRLKLLLDVYHATVLGDDFLEAFHKLRDRVHFVHIHDGNGLKLLELGDGLIPNAEAVEGLAKAGYDGWVLTHGGDTDQGPVEKSRACREYLRSLGY